jgi:DNA-binding response OmpR family regulator
VTKPVGLAELLARVDAALRRPRAARLAAESRPIEFGEVVADLAARTVRRAGVEVRLTPREFDLLVFLAARPGRPFDRDTLLREVWGLGYEGTARTVDNFVRSLRLKLEPDPDAPVHLVTVHGVGYRFSP